MALVSEPLIQGMGTAEHEWRRSIPLSEMPSISFVELLGRSTRLVVLAPHPDDEVLGCGGLIRHAVLENIPVLIVSVSDGERCYPDHPQWSADSLRRARTAELISAAAVLGVDRTCIVHLRVPDGSINSEAKTLAEILQRLLRPADLVLVTWGRDGHPDHEATFDAASTAASFVECRLMQYPVWGWHWMKPDGMELRGLQARRFALSEVVHAAKREAIACFRTQTGQGLPEITDPVLPSHVIERFTRPFEVFVL